MCPLQILIFYTMIFAKKNYAQHYICQCTRTFPHSLMKLTIFLISRNKQLYTKPLFLNINWIWRWCHVGHFTKLYLRQRRLCNIIKTTNAISLIKGMSESVSKFPQTPWKMTNLKESLHFSQAAQVLATFTYVSNGQKWKKNQKLAL